MLTITGHATTYTAMSKIHLNCQKAVSFYWEKITLFLLKTGSDKQVLKSLEYLNIFLPLHAQLQQFSHLSSVQKIKNFLSHKKINKKYCNVAAVQGQNRFFRCLASFYCLQRKRIQWHLFMILNKQSFCWAALRNRVLFC